MLPIKYGIYARLRSTQLSSIKSPTLASGVWWYTNGHGVEKGQVHLIWCSAVNTDQHIQLRNCSVNLGILYPMKLVGHSKLLSPAAYWLSGIIISNGVGLLQNHAVSANRILWVYAGFWLYHGILMVHLQDSVGAFWAIKDRGTSICGLSVENVMTDGLSRVCSWWYIMLFITTKNSGIYFVGDRC